MKRSSRFGQVAALANAFLFVLLIFTCSLSAQDKVQRRALLIGVSEYEKAGFTSLKYPEADVKGIEAELKKAGFKTTLMLSSLGKNNPLRATKPNIELQLLSPAEYREAHSRNRDLNPGFVAGLGGLNKSDLVLVVLAGHGRQELIANLETKRKETVPFFCPTDANRSDSGTWVSINKLMKNVSGFSGSEKNLILIDACRDNPSRGRGIDGKSVSITADNLGICFSSSAGTESYESDKLKHGLFSYYVIEGLKGKASNFRKEVTWNSLTGYVQAMVSEQAPSLVERQQSPHVAGSLKAAPVLIPKTSLRSIASAQPKSPKSSSAPDKSKMETENPTTPNKPLKTYTSKFSSMEFIRIASGSFRMGSEKGSGDEKPVHRVTISKPFYFGKYEVTQKQWKTVMGTEPWKGKAYVKEGDDYPATYVSWDDAVAYCKKLSARDGRTYRLPTEAEWEYACRGGTETEYSFGDTDSALGRYAWYDKNADEIGDKYAHRVGAKESNPFGLFDIHGNVWEWCEDDYSDDFYESTKSIDPVNSTKSSSRVLRGGSWDGSSIYCRSAYRFHFSASFPNFFVGFRVVCEFD